MANTWRLLWPVQSRSEENPGYFWMGGWKHQHKHCENYKVLRIKLNSGTFTAAGRTVSSSRVFFFPFLYFFFYSVGWSNSPQLMLQLKSLVDFSSNGPTISSRLVIAPSVLTPADGGWTPVAKGCTVKPPSLARMNSFLGRAALCKQMNLDYVFDLCRLHIKSIVTWTDAMKQHIQVELWRIRFNLFPFF